MHVSSPKRHVSIIFNPISLLYICIGSSYSRPSTCIGYNLRGFMKVLALWVLFLSVVCLHDAGTEAARHGMRSLVRKEDRRSVTATEYGDISSAEVVSHGGARYHLQFITLEPNTLFLPVLLHSDMVLYAHTGSGRLSWAFDGDDEEVRKVELRRGDIYRLPPGVIFYVQSDLELERTKLRIHAIFANAEEGFYEPSIGAYSSVGDLLRGFSSRLLQEAFMAPEEVVEDITSAERPPPIVHGLLKHKKGKWGREARLIEAYMSERGYAAAAAEVNKKKRKPFNLYKANHDFENCNGWSVALTSKKVHFLDHSNIGVFMVNLTRGSMMAPHWNPTATEIAIVLHGSGMIRVACPSGAAAKESQCKGQSFRVSPGDVFVVPRFHPMAQMSFNNDSLVFMGFATSKKRNYPQFLTGRSSVLRAIRGDILAASFNAGEEAVERLLSRQAESVILECTSCAEEEERAMEEEEEKEREEEEEEERAMEEEEEKEREEEEEEERERGREEERRRRERAAEREQEESVRQEEEIRRRAEEEEEEWGRF